MAVFSSWLGIGADGISISGGLYLDCLVELLITSRFRSWGPQGSMTRHTTNGVVEFLAALGFIGRQWRSVILKGTTLGSQKTRQVPDCPTSLLLRPLHEQSGHPGAGLNRRGIGNELLKILGI